MAKRPDPGKAVRSFGHAGRGLRHVLRSEQNVQIHVLAAAAVIIAAAILEVPGPELAVLLLAIGLVVTAEVINTVIEDLLDIVHPGHQPKVGLVKDVLAGAVLVAAVIAAVVGALIFLPYVFAALR